MRQTKKKGASATPVTKVKTKIVSMLNASEKKEQSRIDFFKKNQAPQKGSDPKQKQHKDIGQKMDDKATTFDKSYGSDNEENEQKVRLIFERQQQRDLKKAAEKYTEGKVMEGYIDLNEKFTIKNSNMNLNQLIQYATYYFLRLSVLKEQVIKASKIKWKHELDKLVYVKDILDIKYDTKTVIAGTIYKEMIKKPCILKHLDGVLGSRRPKNYCSENDLIILEDSSGRIRIKQTDFFKPGWAITGSIVCLKGHADIHGIFHIEDYTFANYHQSAEMSIPRTLKLGKPKRQLLDDSLLLSDRKFIAFISGLEIGIEQDALSVEILCKLFRGESGSVDEQKLMSQVQRLIICGNSLVPPEGVENVQKGSYGCASLNQTCYTKINDHLDSLENTINKLSFFIDVDIMPGEFDISTAHFPQQPLNKAMFPNLLKPDRVNFVTNPHQFCVNGIRMLGTSGQNIKDIRMFSESHKEPSEIMEHTLNMRHICPTSPDTLRAYSFTENDPFILGEAPHLYFAGNQPVYSERWVTNDQAQKKIHEDREKSYDKLIQENPGFKKPEQDMLEPEDIYRATKILSIPTFRTKRKFVLVDLETLDCYDYQIDCTSLINIDQNEQGNVEDDKLDFSQQSSQGQIEFDEDGASQD